jgi:hypothetical protein
VDWRGVVWQQVFTDEAPPQCLAVATSLALQRVELFIASDLSDLAPHL